ncbi:hypothetical protein WEH80_22350 [Actinomycetes bacterium KLBMP 9759]
MDERRDTPARLPVARTPGEPPPARRGPRFSWRALVRSPRGAVGLAALAAALLLWPFSGLSWIPWLAGLGALLVLRILRLEGPLRGWDLPLAAVIVVVGLMLSTGPWAWALAASIGVLLAGIAQLPWWRLAAVGAALCLVTGVGFGFANWQTREQEAKEHAATSERTFAVMGERKPERVLGALLEGIGQGDIVGVCGLMDEQARAAFVQAAKAASCADAVVAFRQAAGAPPRSERLDATVVPVGGAWLADGCRTAWAQAPLGGPALGRLEVRKSAPPGATYFIAAFAAC